MALRTPLPVCLLAAACTGPALHVANPDGHAVFVDGVATTAASLPFRYYGTVQWDALPKDAGDRADWTRVPTRGEVAVAPPAPGWLFPLDFFVEVADRALHGRQDATTAVRADAATPDPRGETEIVNIELAQLATRARAARSSR